MAAKKRRKPTQKTVTRAGKKTVLRGKKLESYLSRSRAAKKAALTRRKQTTEYKRRSKAAKKAAKTKQKAREIAVTRKTAAGGFVLYDQREDFFYQNVLPALRGPLRASNERKLAPYYGKTIRIDVIGRVLETTSNTFTEFAVAREVEPETYVDVIDVVRDLVKELSQERKKEGSPYAYLVSLASFVPSS